MAFVAEQRGIDVRPVPELQREVSPLGDSTAVRHLVEADPAGAPARAPHAHRQGRARSDGLRHGSPGQRAPPVVVHTFHGHTLEGYFGPAKQAAYRLVERALARETDALIAVSPEVRDDLVAIGVAPASQFAVVRLGIELSERMEGAEQRRRAARLARHRPGRFTSAGSAG